MNTVACLTVAMSAVSAALGNRPQFVFPDDMTWLWWPVAIVWMLFALNNFVREES